ncbi:carboxymuconolactone decarboxylase family protein [Phenylobacterium sp.]|uniref:carboxymuconolactone decarboxylase family protein n=1 Tax=Phenylobacterium sp. TaxID=1871053 RepID=UPI002811B49A|nr:carboxymuconolactone decarboxylase family protein [Phenylobacterium sp.]
MTTRLQYYAVEPKALEAMMGLENAVRASGLEYSLLELVKMRASQINGCAFCLHMHSQDARKAGETEDRLHLLAAWRESSLYTPRERAALAWTESLTRVADTAAPDADYEPLKAHFTEQEIVWLTMMIVAINGWNRLAVGFRSQHPRAWKAAA